ncbi:MAG: class I SAM-dependent methyltransferase [Planctomycetota bacterium]|nr:class I SAM-dependent methyltransferase [Planctomycetota bacterium]
MESCELPCQLCGEKGLAKFEIKGSSTLWLCSHCELYQYGKIVTEAAYESSYHKGYEKHRAKKIRTARVRLNRIQPLLGKTGSGVPRILDVGCSIGATLEAAKLFKWEAQGVDVSGDAVDYCCSKGLDVKKVGGFELPFDDHTFDVVVNWHVIEHVADVRQTLTEWCRVLKPGGILFVETPDAASPKVRKLGTAYRKFWAPEHTYTFTYDNLGKFLGEAGLEIIQGPWLGSLVKQGPLMGAYAVIYRAFHGIRRRLGVHKEFQIFARKNIAHGDGVKMDRVSRVA